MITTIASLLLLCASLICCSTSSFGQSSVGRVGVVSIQAAIVGTAEGKKASQELGEKVQAKQKSFDQRQAELAQLQDQFAKSGTMLSEDKRSALNRDIEQKKKLLERDVSDAKEELAQQQQTLIQGFGQRMLGLIEAYAKEKGFSMILDISAPTTPVIFASPSIDITQDIVARYDQANAPKK